MSWLRRHVQPAAMGDGGHLVAWRSRRLVARPVLLLALVIGVADVLFAFDSIPAVFGITTSAYLIVACNAFALMELRQVYVLLARVLDRIVYLNTRPGRHLRLHGHQACAAGAARLWGRMGASRPRPGCRSSSSPRSC